MSTKLESHGQGNILVLNAGSSSLKFASFHAASGQSPTRTLHGTVEGIGTAPKLQAWAHEGGPMEEVALSPNPTSRQSPPCITDPAQGQQAALAALLSWLKAHPTQGPLLAAAHRVVHGGESFTEHTWVTPKVLQQLDALVPLAPLHQPHNLAAIQALANLQPGLPQLACFDTAFHAHQSWVAQAYALPQCISQKGVKRHGFHGVSCEYIASVLPQHLGEAAQGRVVVAHLGNGASLGAMAAVLGGLDALVFTAGMGEHSTLVRERVCEQAQWLGLSFSPEANAAHQACISTPGSQVSAWVIPTNEEWMIAQHAQEMLLSPA